MKTRNLNGLKKKMAILNVEDLLKVRGGSGAPSSRDGVVR